MAKAFTVQREVRGKSFSVSKSPSLWGSSQDHGVLLFSGISSCCQATFTSGFGMTRTGGGVVEKVCTVSRWVHTGAKSSWEP